jgi:hypothetical protein
MTPAQMHVLTQVHRRAIGGPEAAATTRNEGTVTDLLAFAAMQRG